MTDIRCPYCGEKLEIGESLISGKGWTAPVYYINCLNDSVGEDPNWGGGYDCGLFIVRESAEAAMKELKLKYRTDNENIP